MFPFANPMQLCGQAMMLAQSGWTYECMGNPAMAGQAYQQAVQTLSSVRAQTGGFLPDQVLFCLGSCQVRLGWLSYAGGNHAWAEQWLRLALPELEAAWRSCPHNPWYQSLLGQTAMLLGRRDLAEAVCRSAGAHLDPIRHSLGTMAPPAHGPGGGQQGGWMKWAKQGKELLDLLGKLTGDASPPWAQGAGGMDWGGGDPGGGMGGMSWWG